MKSLFLALVICLFATACGSNHDSSPTSDAGKPGSTAHPSDPGGITPSEANQRYAIEFNAVYDRDSECRSLACVGQQLGSTWPPVPNSIVTEPTLETSKTRYVFSGQVELHCVRKHYLVADVVDTSCRLIFNLAGKERNGIEVSRAGGPFANVFKTKISEDAGVVEKLAKQYSSRQLLPEPEIEVPLESGRVARMPRLKLACERQRSEASGKDIYASCTFTGVAQAL